MEHMIVTRSRTLIGPTDAAEELGVGDYICYKADQPHIFSALEPDTMAIMVAEQPWGGLAESENILTRCKHYINMFLKMIGLF